MIYFTRAMLLLALLAFVGAAYDLIFGGPDCPTDWAAVGILAAVISYTALRTADEEDETGPKEPHP